MKTFVYIETAEGKVVSGSLEALTPAKTLGDVTAVLVGGADAAAQVAALGVSTLVVDTEACCPDKILAALESVAAKENPEVVLFSATQLGKDLAPRLAKRLGGGCVTDVTAVELKDGSAIFTRPAYGGNILEQMAVTAAPACVTVRSGSFAKPAPAEGGKVETVAADLPADAVKAKLVKVAHDIAETVDLESADVIVAGGLGMGSAEGFHMVEELAALLGGVVGASRPAIENGWVTRAHQIGQSGKTVAPKLYIACGISGATQHISGALGSKYIVAINKDEDAPIFRVADVGIVGDVHDILPAFMAELRKVKGE